MDKFVGIDVSKDRLDVHVRPSGEVIAFAQDAGGHTALVEHLRAWAVTIIGIEATGGYETAAVAALALAGLPVVVVNPAQVRAFATAIGKRAKTDPIDAAVIAHFVEATHPEVRALPDAATRLLSDLIARRKQIVEMASAERQRQHRAVDPVLKRSIARMVRAMEKELASLDQSIDDNVRGSPAWRVKEDLLVTVPGIGKTIARTLIADMPELGTLDRRKIAALAGLAPQTRQSGRWTGKTFIGGGCSPVRAALFMGALVAAKHNPVLRAFRDRLVAAGKSKIAAIVAVARKLLTMLNAILRDACPWTLEQAHAKASI